MVKPKVKGVRAFDDCHRWNGATNGKGYGTTRIGGKLYLAHRVEWEIHNGEIPKGMWILHKCDNPICVNINHLEIGDRKKNMRDCVARGRHNQATKTHCKNGHLYSKENTRILKRKTFTERICVTCDRATKLRSYYLNRPIQPKQKRRVK